MGSEVEEIAGKLSKAHREALTHENAGGCAYRWARIGTLQALNSRGLVGRIGGLGETFSPETAICWPLTFLGKAVRNHLIGSVTHG